MLVGVQTCTTTLESIWQFLRKLGIVLLQGLAIPFLGIYPKDDLPYHKDTYSIVFIAALLALLAIARTRKQPRCASTEEWILKCTFTQLNITQLLKTMAS
jgi:Na+/melibiose symporter-like transporter